MLFAQFIETARTFASEHALLVVAGSAVAIGFLVIIVRRQRAAMALNAAANVVSRVLDEEKAANWDPPEQSYADRRGAVRREGAPVRVLLSSSTFRNGVNDGFVVDRSTGGLRLLLQSAVAPGTSVGIKAVNAPDTIGFVNVIVRSCRKNGDHFVVGCEFEKTPPWNVLLLFG